MFNSDELYQIENDQNNKEISGFYDPDPLPFYVWHPFPQKTTNNGERGAQQRNDSASITFELGTTSRDDGDQWFVQE
jgi:hypothetical protein